MANVTNAIQIKGPLEPVFDLVTTTRFWIQWHPATIGVGRVTERPLLLNDVVRERAKIGPQVYEGEWTVVEHDRPRRLVLRGSSGRIQISYAFTPQAEGVLFSRELTFNPEDFRATVADPAGLEKFMFNQSEEALRKLKRLVEGILAAESRPEIKAETVRD